MCKSPSHLLVFSIAPRHILPLTSMFRHLKAEPGAMHWFRHAPEKGIVPKYGVDVTSPAEIIWEFDLRWHEARHSSRCEVVPTSRIWPLRTMVATLSFSQPSMVVEFPRTLKKWYILQRISPVRSTSGGQRT